MNIVIAMHHEPGHCNGSFALARRLRDRGHRVTYLGLMDARPGIVEQGFEFVPFAEGIVAEGELARSNEPVFRRFLQSFTDGHLDQRLVSAKPDVLLCDSCVWYVALRATALHIPTVNIGLVFSNRPNAYIPPFFGSRVPRVTGWGRMQVRADWLWLRLQFVFTRRLASALLGRFRSPSRMHNLTGEFRKLAKRSGIDAKESRSYQFTEMGPRMMLPEIVLPPRSFDFPHPPDADRVYLGDFVDLRRKEDATLLNELDARRPVVYCALGSVPGYYPHAGRLFRAVVAASKLRKDWQWVLSVGADHDADGFGEAGSNLWIVKWAPQLALLERSATMVTHGGINSIMECIHFQVPMVIIPGLRDQPGNMARAVHHGIAVPGDMKRITPGSLVEMVARAMHDTAVRRALSEMKKRIAAETGVEAAIERIESSNDR